MPGSSSSSSRGSVTVYPVKDPTSLYNKSALLAKAMLPPGVNPDKQHFFSISPASGWMRYSDRSMLWQKIPSAAVPQAQDWQQVLATAKKFISDVTTRLNADPDMAKLGLTPPSVNDLDSKIVAVANPSKKVAGIDHWLCRFQPSLNAGTPGKIPLIGAGIDVRIGKDSTIVGFAWRWRTLDKPQTAMMNCPLLPPPSSGGSSDGSSAPILVYLAADEGVTQKFLAPYYISSFSDDAPDISPASTYSLMAELSQTQQGNTTQITCQAWGGSGQYDYKWNCWSPLESFDGETPPTSQDSQQTVGNQQVNVSTISLSPGVYNVIVNVTDTSTTANIQIQRTCYLGYPVSTPAGQSAPSSLIS